MNTGPVDQDSALSCRFCWPLQDRARAETPTKAPRTSSVFTASVSFGSDSPASAPNAHAVVLALLRNVPKARLHAVFEVDDVSCGCCMIGLPGQAHRPAKLDTDSNRDSWPLRVGRSRKLKAAQAGLALGLAGG